MENPLAHFPQPELVDQPSAPVLASSNVPPLASPLPHSLPSRPPESFMHKNRLQEFTQRSSIQLPVYQTVNEGSVHAPQFRSSVLVDGVTYTSETTFSSRKAAEQDVAKHALECISKKLKDEGCPLIREDTVFCKSILNEFVVKMNLELPTYNTIQSGGVLPLFVSTLVFNGATYRGETGRNKKEAEQLAARVVIQSLLADDRYGTVVSEIIKSKAKLYDALNKAKDSSFDTTLAGANRLNHNNTEVENNAVTNHVPNTTHPSSGAKHLRHEFKISKSGEGTDCIDLPIAFVPAVIGQGSDAGESSLKKQRKKKKRAKLNTTSQSVVAGSPFNQTTPCSLAL
ncbi:hypothetical protein E1A91_A12G059800v1 [Gossypium mustelinum]|uniref:DRBM domain-containing protein n=2 Tax=Gossypium mustelinum TaxID=34275 RepID=A0A5D2WQ87_GOSMU|nr:hypothetical protein E1A91_A12G059800v1 [Gossypium mustelinum]TYJ03915.1 hypothetical protein E1A91_A12G059800v1 [Gossypium mustelinum]TYJ03917.1 hypothetical protein E1A91_A12G059800v1 [Gossypium mustelinum]TYJ03919.1 hypothetical protein E1A91_A12G059800v1 [Gossypium mustelinum]